ncbi:MAG TPA: 2-dehydropantoate 2-reductase [Gemmatimonadales bacterium]|jgi:2-dehydropantoate 2-reductase|nr:2-dehydropantoate 2-reductase [Gemmatimonadales bacterium]
MSPGDPQPKLLVLGAGALGGYYGGRLAQAGVDVTFLVRPRREEQLRRDGLRIESPLGNLSRPVATVRADTVAPGYDFVLLTSKAYDLDAAMDAIAPAMNGRCAIVPILNGMAHYERLDRRFGEGTVMGGTAMIDATLAPDGVIHHNGTLQRIVFGERDGRRTPRVEWLAAMFARSSLEAMLAPDIVQVLWDKLVFLSALAATTCLFRANVREIMAAPGGKEAVERTLAANALVAAAAGHPLREDVLATARTRLTDPAGTWSASLLRDMEAGGQVEADHILGWMLDQARRYQVDDTMLSLAYTALKAYEARRDAGRLLPRPT